MTTSHNSKPRCNPLENVRFITVLGILLIAVLGVFVLDMIGSRVSSYVAERNQKKHANWLVAEGVPRETRVIKDRRALYVGECSVEYTVEGKQYTVWAASGYLDPDQHWMAEKMRACPVYHYTVHYNPKDPSDAFAEKLDGQP